MRVRLKVAATVPTIIAEGQTEPPRHDWMPAGTECDLDEEHFNPEIHERLDAPPSDSPGESPATSEQGTDAAASASPSITSDGTA